MKLSLKRYEVAWLACALDAEGSLTWNGKKQNGRFYPQIRVYNTNRVFVERFASLTEGVIYIQATQGFGQTPIYACCVRSRDKVRALLVKLLSYLIVKRERAEQVLKWFSENTPVTRSEAMKRYWNSLTVQERVALRLKLYKARWGSAIANPGDPFGGLHPSLPSGEK